MQAIPLNIRTLGDDFRVMKGFYSPRALGKKDLKSAKKALILLNIDIQNLRLNQHGKNHSNC